MTLTRALFLSLMALLACASFGAHANADGAGSMPPRYFTALPFRETPFDPLRGIHEITAEEARVRHHFRFDYDARGRPVRVAFMSGGRIITLNDTASLYFPTPRVDIEYQPGREIRTFYDRHGNRILSDGPVFSHVFEMDARGHYRSLAFFGVDGAPAENSWGVNRYEWRIEDDGTLAERRFNRAGAQVELRAGFPFYEIRLHYGANGWLALMQNYGTEGRLTTNNLNAAQDRIEYSTAGDFLSWTVLDEAGGVARGNSPNVARGIMERDRHGYDVAERYEDENGAPIASAYGWSFTRGVFDRHGNRIERANYTLDGRELMISETRGYAGYTAEFDRYGNRTSIAFFGAAREPILPPEVGYHRATVEYDAQGNAVRVRYLGLDGQLIEPESTGVAMIEQVFDDRGRRTEQRLLDRAGNPVNERRAGFAVERRTYGEHGVPTEIAWFTADGRPVPPAS